MQNRYSLLHRDLEAEVAPAAEQFGLGILPYFPLEFGLLTGKYRRGQEAPGRLPRRHGTVALARARRLGPDRGARPAFAEARGLSLLDVAIAGLAAQPAVASVIAGATRGDQVRANAAALRWEPDRGRPGRSRPDHPLSPTAEATGSG